MVSSHKKFIMVKTIVMLTSLSSLPFTEIMPVDLSMINNETEVSSLYVVVLPSTTVALTCIIDVPK